MIEHISKNKARFVINTGSGKHRKRRAKTVTYSGKRELERLYREFEDEVRRNPMTDATVDELMDSYIRNCKVRGIVATTLNGYENIQKRISPALGHVKAKDLTTYNVDNFIADLSEKYAPKTIASTISFLRSAYDRAIRTGQLEKNPCEKVTLPKRKKKEINTLDEPEIMTMMKVFEEQRLDFQVGYELALMCGLRRSEVLGLREEDVNLEFGRIVVRQTRHIVKGVEHIQDTKTASSYRILALPQRLIADITRLIDEHHALPYDSSEYLIQDGFGQPMNPSTFSNRIVKLEQASGVSHVSLHGLRHTFASLLNSENVDIARISAELGHSNITTTLNIYTHVFGSNMESSQGIASVVDRAFEKPATILPLPNNEKTAEA